MLRTDAPSTSIPITATCFSSLSTFAIVAPSVTVEGGGIEPHSRGLREPPTCNRRPPHQLRRPQGVASTYRHRAYACTARNGMQAYSWEVQAWRARERRRTSAGQSGDLREPEH